MFLGFYSYMLNPTSVPLTVLGSHAVFPLKGLTPTTWKFVPGLTP